MRGKMVLTVLMALMLCPLSSAQSQKKGPWMHLEVLEKGDDPETVKVNLPISLVDVAMNLVKDKNIREGRMKFDHSDVSVAEMKQLWNELKNSGNADFVTVEKKDEKIRISREGSFVLVNVNDTRKSDKVAIKIPVSVVDALLSGPGEELNLKAAVTAMKEQNVGDILTVNDSHSQVRLWID